jgi:hypothetical protein
MSAVTAESRLLMINAINVMTIAKPNQAMPITFSCFFINVVANQCERPATSEEST